MIRCKCGGKTQVTNTRPLDDGIWRQRTCLECIAKVTTFEQVCVTIASPRGAIKGSTKENPIPHARRGIHPIECQVIQKNKVRSEPPGPRTSTRNKIEDIRMQKELDGGY
jgi:transcriptional regulator NrdR family protein